MSAPASRALTVTDIAVPLIDLPAGRRRIDPNWVEALAGLFADQGQKTPIEVIAEGERYRLVYGAHRLAAAQRAGWSTIAATVRSRAEFASEAEITLREITENLARRELSVLDRAVDIARWREVYEATHLLNKGGRKRSAKLAPRSVEDDDELSAKFALSFSEAARQSFDLSRRSIFFAVRIASIPAELRDRIALHAIADNQSELLALAAETPERQASIVAMLTSEPPQAGSVADAIALIDRMPKPGPMEPFAKVSAGFSKLKAKDQERFFALHEAAIMLWLRGRGA